MDSNTTPVYMCEEDGCDEEGFECRSYDRYEGYVGCCFYCQKHAEEHGYDAAGIRWD